MIPCIIPARGGSKSIPRKNLVDICGKPLIAWSIEQALACPLIDEVWVSSDDVEILRTARQYGAQAWKRAPELATDTASSDDAVREWMDYGDIARSECIVFLQATSPIRQPDDIANAVQLLKDTAADSVFSAREVHGYCWHQGAVYLSPLYFKRLPRQLTALRTLEENGSIYVFRPSILKIHGQRLGGHVEPYLMHPLDSFQIDEPQDIPLIEQLMELRMQLLSTTRLPAGCGRLQAVEIRGAP